MDRWTRLEGGIAVVLHLRSSHNQVAGRFISVIVKGRRTGQTVNKTMPPRRRANESRPSRCDIFPTGCVVSVLRGPGGPTGSQWSSAWSEARGGEEGKGTKGSERVVGKVVGDECVFMSGSGPSWQMRSGPTPCQTRRAVRVVTGSLNNGKALRRKAFTPTPSLLGQFNARHVHAGEAVGKADLTANED